MIKRKFSLKRKDSLRAKKKTVEQILASQEQRDKDRAFYSLIWSKRPHRCQICSAPLYGEINKANCDHILEKSKYPNLRYEEENIILVCIHCHAMKTNGNISPLYREVIEKAKEQFL